MNITEFIKENLRNSFEETLTRLDEAFRNKDFEQAAKILRNILAKNGHGSTMHSFGLDNSGQETISLLGIAKSLNIAATINFNVGTDSTIPNSITVFHNSKDVVRLIGDITTGNTAHSYATTTYEVDAINTLQIINAVNKILTTGDDVAAMRDYYTTMGESIEGEDANMLMESYEEDRENLDTILAPKKLTAKATYLVWMVQRAMKNGYDADVAEYNDKLDELGFERITGKIVGSPAQNVRPNGKAATTAATAAPAGTPTTSRIKVDKYADQRAFEELLLGKYSLIEKIEDMKKYTEIMCKKNNPNVAIFSGAPGIGKTYNVEKILEKNRGKRDVRVTPESVGWTRIAGDITPVALYAQLINWSNLGDIVMFDDCDGLLMDKVSANLIKGACDTGKTRNVGWFKNATPQIDEQTYTSLMNKLVKKYGSEDNIPVAYAPTVKSNNSGMWYFAPKQFEFKANVIILTNMSLDKVPSAIKNRGVALDLDSSEEEKLALIQTVKDLVESANPEIRLSQHVRDFTFDCIKEYAVALDVAKAQGKDVKGSITIRSYLTACEAAACFEDSCSDAELKRYVFKKILSENAASGSHE
jgi:hypothetical protein